MNASIAPESTRLKPILVVLTLVLVVFDAREMNFARKFLGAIPVGMASESILSKANDSNILSA